MFRKLSTHHYKMHVCTQFDHYFTYQVIFDLERDKHSTKASSISGDVDFHVSREISWFHNDCLVLLYYTEHTRWVIIESEQI